MDALMREKKKELERLQALWAERERAREREREGRWEKATVTGRPLSPIRNVLAPASVGLSGPTALSPALRLNEPKLKEPLGLPSPSTHHQHQHRRRKQGRVPPPFEPMVLDGSAVSVPHGDSVVAIRAALDPMGGPASSRTRPIPAPIRPRGFGSGGGGEGGVLFQHLHT